MPKAKLTRQLADSMRADHASGMTVAECARKYGVSWNHAKRIIVGETWTGKPRANQLADAVVDAIRRRLANGDKPTWIAMVECVDHSIVYNIKNRRRRFAA